MRKLIILALLASLGLVKAEDTNSANRPGYAPNTGKSVPGTFSAEEKKNFDVKPKTREIQPERSTAQKNPAELHKVLTPEKMNTAPTPTPDAAYESERFNKTLSTGEITPEEGILPIEDATKEAEEEDVLDYSTSPGR